MSLRRCECCHELFKAIDNHQSDTLCDFCANEDAEPDKELEMDELLAQQELEDFENHYGPCDNYEDRYLDSYYEDRYEIYDSGDY